MSDAVIKVENLSKVYKLYKDPVDRLKEALNPFGKKYHHDFYALKDVNFEVKKGETIGIIGKNGSGKSTLLKILTGVLTQTSGTCRVRGKVSSLLELGAGFNPELSGIENVYFNGSILGYSREEMDSKLDAILQFADIGEFVYQPVKTYSSGMQVRLAFAVAISVDPDVLIVDEALAVGDMSFQKKCMEKIDSFREEGKTIIFCSHDMHSVSALCHRAMWLKDGTIAEIGKADFVISSYVSWMTDSAVSSLNATCIEKKDHNPNHYIRNSEEVEIVSVKVMDELGASKKIFFTGEDLVLDVNFVVKNGIIDPKYSLLILKADGTPVAITKSNYYELISEGQVKGERSIRISLPNIRLNSGKYIIGFSIWDKSSAIQFATHRVTEIEIKSLNIVFGQLEEQVVFFPETIWSLDNHFSSKNIKQFDIANVKFFDELNVWIESNGINKKDICIVGSSALAIWGLKENNDVDVVITSDLRGKIDINDSVTKISNHLEVVSSGWARILGITDDDLVNDKKYYNEFDGFKFVKPEILYSVKKMGGRDKDYKDVVIMENSMRMFDDWDFQLIDLFRAYFIENELDKKASVAVIPLGQLLSNQYKSEKYGRYDIIVRYMAIQEILGANSGGLKLYKKMQESRVGESEKYVDALKTLISSVSLNGYDENSRITVDKSFNLHDGSHRLALASYFNVNEIPVTVVRNNTMMAEYGLDWFFRNGFGGEELELIELERIKLFGKLGLFFHIMLWPSVYEYFDEINRDISLKYKVVDSKDYFFKNAKDFDKFTKDVYKIDDIEDWKINKKIKGMEDFDKNIKVITVEIPNPRFRKKEMNMADISIEVERIKRYYRNLYAPKVPKYFHDIILHVGDNFQHNSKLHELFLKYDWAIKK